MSQVKEQAIAMHSRIKRTHEHLVRFAARMDEAAQAPMTQGDRADVALLLDRISKLLDDARKKVGGAGDTVQEVACMMYVTSDEKGPIRGEFCTASPNLKMRPKLPSKTKDPDGYVAMMTHLGVKPELIAAGILDAHWPRMTEWLSDKVAAGEKLPPGVDPKASVPDYSLTLRERSEVPEPLAVETDAVPVDLSSAISRDDAKAALTAGTGKMFMDVAGKVFSVDPQDLPSIAGRILSAMAAHKRKVSNANKT